MKEFDTSNTVYGPVSGNAENTPPENSQPGSAINNMPPPPSAPQPPPFYYNIQGQENPEPQNQNAENSEQPNFPPNYRVVQTTQQPPEKVRRVGSITMALALITVGVLLVLKTFIPGIDLVMIARLSPLLLVFLGIEMLISNTFAKDRRIKYDILGIFVCIILIGVSMMASILPDIITKSINSEQVSRRLSKEFSAAGQKELSTTSPFESATVEGYISVSDTAFSNNMKLSDISIEQYVQFRVYFNSTFETKEEFANACHEVSNVIAKTVPHVDYASFYSSNNNSDRYTGEKRFIMYVDNYYQFNQNADRFLQYVQTDYWDKTSGGYISEQQYMSSESLPGESVEVSEDTAVAAAG